MTSQIKPQTLIDQILRFAAPTLFGMPERMANGLMIVICAAIAFLVMGKLVITTQAYSSIMNAVGILYLSAAAFLIMGSLQYRKQYQNLMTDHVRADIFDGEHLVHQMAGIDIATIDLGILKSRYFWKLGLTTVSEQLVHAVYRARNLFGILIFWLPAIMPVTVCFLATKGFGYPGRENFCLVWRGIARSGEYPDCVHTRGAGEHI